MEGEAAIKKSVDSISILLVDHDTTSLAMVAMILKDFNYQVVMVEHPNNALDTLRAKRGSFDLVISDLRTSDMDGIELQQAISQEFDLPVIILMSEDESDSDLILKALEDGAVFCITKPVRPDDLRDVWQFVDMKGRKNKADVAPPPFKRKGFLDQEDEEEDINFQAAPTKRPKVIWTLSLQNRFLDALRKIGVENAVPKTILEEMNVPGLTRENVASHLQKYRNFLRRVVDASKRIDHKRGADKIFGHFSINDISNIDHI